MLRIAEAYDELARRAAKRLRDRSTAVAMKSREAEMATRCGNQKLG
jgi:hypothetical protein